MLISFTLALPLATGGFRRSPYRADFTQAGRRQVHPRRFGGRPSCNARCAAASGHAGQDRRYAREFSNFGSSRYQSSSRAVHRAPSEESSASRSVRDAMPARPRRDYAKIPRSSKKGAPSFDVAAALRPPRWCWAARRTCSKLTEKSPASVARGRGAGSGAAGGRDPRCSSTQLL